MSTDNPKKPKSAGRGYSKLMDYIVTRTDIPSDAKLVHAILCRLQGRSASCWPSYGTIAKMCGISRRSAIRSVQTLEDLGYLNRVQFQGTEGKNLTTRFSLYKEVEASRRRMWAQRRASEKSRIVSFPKQGEG